MKALDARDAAVFFGREADIVRGLDALRGQREQGIARLFVILGASGSGKSSFLRAGLWPRLKRDDRHFIPLPLIRPEREPMSGPTGLVASLEAAFRELRQPKTRAIIRSALREPEGFKGLLAEVQDLARSPLGPDTPSPAVVIAIDQGEELYAADVREESEALLAILGQALTPPSTAVEEGIADQGLPLVMIAIRSDSYERLQSDPRLARVGRTLFNLPPLSHAEFKMVIEGPALRATAAGRRLTMDPRLTNRLLQDVEGGDALPLLAFTLERLLVEYGGDGDLRLEEYDSLGGFRGSIEAAVNAAFADPDSAPAIPRDTAERNRVLRQGFVPWLARVDPGTEERKRRVARWEEIPVGARPLLERLIAQRLLVRDLRRVEGSHAESVVVEVAHEALLRQWPTLTAWLDEDAEALKAADATRRAAGEWLKNNRDALWLVHSGERLERAEVLQQREDFGQLMGDDVRAYLKSCRARDEAVRVDREAQLQRLAQEQARVSDEQARTARAQRWTKMLLASIAVVLFAAGAWVVTQSRAVARQTSFVLAAAAEAASDAGLYDRALRLSVLAVRENWLSPTVPEAGPQLLRAVYASRLVAQFVGFVGFSADGGRVVTASSEGTARVWDAATGKELAVLRGHQDTLLSAAFSGNGRRVLTVSADQTVRVWDAATGQELAALRGHEAVWSAAFGGDGRRVLIVSADKTARVWDAVTGQELVVLRGHEAVWSAAFGGDGRRVLTASDDKTVRVWDAATGQELAVLRGHERSVWSAAFSGDGRRVVTASDDKTARVWDAVTGQALVVFRGHEAPVKSAAFSGDGRRVVTASEDETARVWDAATGQELAVLRGHEGVVESAAFAGEGRRVVTASNDKTARVWEAETGKERMMTLLGRWAFTAFNGDGRRLVTWWDKTAWVFDAATGQEVAVLRGHEGKVGFAAFSGDGGRVVTASDDQTARVWDAETGRELAVLRGHQGIVFSAAFSGDGRRVITASGDQTARVWDTATGKEQAVLRGRVVMSSTATWSSTTFSGDGRRVMTVSDDKTVRVWDAATGKELTVLRGADGWLAAFSADGRRVVTTSLDGPARVWDAATGREQAVLRGRVAMSSNAAWSSIAISGDGRRVVIASSDGTAQVWDVANGKEVAILRGHGGAVWSTAFNGDGSRVVTTSVDARVWDAVTGKELAVLPTHQGVVVFAAFSGDGRRVLTASSDGTASVWDVRALMEYRGPEMIATACAQKLSGAAALTADDLRAAPILRGREDEDVCAPPSLLAHTWNEMRRLLSRSSW